MKLLLHICCGPCASAVLESLQAEPGMDPTGYWYNPNLHPAREHDLRLASAEEVARFYGIGLLRREPDLSALRAQESDGAELLDGDPDRVGIRDGEPGGTGLQDGEPGNAGFLSPAEGLAFWRERFTPPAGGRCAFCYRHRLDAAAEHAAKNGYDAFSTSLMISPYQSREAMVEAGLRAQRRWGVAFLDTDFRPLYRRSRELVRANRWYSQKYCGCVFSWEDSDHPKKPAWDWTELP